MDEHQRLVWGRMIEAVDRFWAGDLELAKLVSDLQGLLGAADIHDGSLVEEFWSYFAPIDGEFELRTEPWAPPGGASDDHLRDALHNYRRWAQHVLDTSGAERR